MNDAIFARFAGARPDWFDHARCRELDLRRHRYRLTRSRR